MIRSLPPRRPRPTPEPKGCVLPPFPPRAPRPTPCADTGDASFTSAPPALALSVPHRASAHPPPTRAPLPASSPALRPRHLLREVLPRRAHSGRAAAAHNRAAGSTPAAPHEQAYTHHAPPPPPPPPFYYALRYSPVTPQPTKFAPSPQVHKAAVHLAPFLALPVGANWRPSWSVRIGRGRGDFARRPWGGCAEWAVVGRWRLGGDGGDVAVWRFG